jgi:hypothetical protein
MSDTSYAAVSSQRSQIPINVIDENWEQEMLSDDGW